MFHDINMRELLLHGIEGFNPARVGATNKNRRIMNQFCTQEYLSVFLGNLILFLESSFHSLFKTSSGSRGKEGGMPRLPQ